MNWLQSESINHNKPFGFNVVKHKNNRKLSITEKRANTYYPLNLSFAFQHGARGARRHQLWIDQVCKYAGRGLRGKNSTKVATRNKIYNSERLVAALRNKYQTNNVALFVFVNGYFENHASFTFNSSLNGELVEYAILTGKNPAVIAHEFLHLFGAIDFYPTLRYSNFNFKELNACYSNEIMYVQHKEIKKLMISPITKYLIGWQDTIDHKNTRMLYHKLSFLDY